MRKTEGMERNKITVLQVSVSYQDILSGCTHVDLLDCALLLAVLALEDCPPVLVELDGGNDNVAWVDANGSRRAV